LERDFYSRKRLAPQLRSEVATFRGDGVQRNLEFITKHVIAFQGYYFTMGFGQTCLSLFHYERFLATGKRKHRKIGRKCQRHVTFLSFLPFDLNL
jgi:hypothetical protein